MLGWNDYRKQLMGRIGEFGRLAPDTLKYHQIPSAAGGKTEHLDTKTRELIALNVDADMTYSARVMDALAASVPA